MLYSRARKSGYRLKAAKRKWLKLICVLLARSLGIGGVFQAPAEPLKCSLLPFSCISTLLRQYMFSKPLLVTNEEGKLNDMTNRVFGAKGDNANSVPN